MSDIKRPYYLNITEIRGMPLIVINAYQGLIFILFLVFIRWMVFAIEHVCKRQGAQHDNPGSNGPCCNDSVKKVDK